MATSEEYSGGATFEVKLALYEMQVKYNWKG